MSDAPAQKQFPCPTCGSEARWSPAERALVCISCETRSPANVELDSAGEHIVTEHPLTEHLRKTPDSARGWQALKTEMHCETCGAISVFDEGHVASSCDFCGSTALAAHSELRPSLRPESVLPFKITEAQARESVRTWYGRQWLAPEALKTKAMTDTVRGLYIPYWTFDAIASAGWSARIGRTDGGNNSRLHWSVESGRLETHFDDVLVPASRGVSHDALTALEPFPTGELQPYHPGFVAGWVIERYQLDLANAAVLGRQRMDAGLKQLCLEKLPGRRHENLRCDARYSGQTFKPILVPVWILNYMFRGEPYQVLVNGSTGRITGSFPTSRVKSSAAIAAAAAIAVILLWAIV